MNKTLKYTLFALGGLTLFGASAYIVYKKRKTISKIGRKAIDIAKQEFVDWNKDGKRKEQDPSMLDNIKKYWQEGTDTFWSEAKMVNEAWSAAFISYLMKKAGAGNNFKYSVSHSEYIRDAIKNRKENNKNPFKGYRPQEVKIEKGDIVCYPRQSGVGYDTTGNYASHCDLVIDIKDDKAITIGGNVSNSVSKTEVGLDKTKKIKDKKYFVVIKNEPGG